MPRCAIGPVRCLSGWSEAHVRALSVRWQGRHPVAPRHARRSVGVAEGWHDVPVGDVGRDGAGHRVPDCEIEVGPHTVFVAGGLQPPGSPTDNHWAVPGRARYARPKSAAQRTVFCAPRGALTRWSPQPMRRQKLRQHHAISTHQGCGGSLFALRVASRVCSCRPIALDRVLERDDPSRT